jgi:hypothetical protein
LLKRDVKKCSRDSEKTFYIFQVDENNRNLSKNMKEMSYVESSAVQTTNVKHFYVTSKRAYTTTRGEETT